MKNQKPRVSIKIVTVFLASLFYVSAYAQTTCADNLGASQANIDSFTNLIMQRSSLSPEGIALLKSSSYQSSSSGGAAQYTMRRMAGTLTLADGGKLGSVFIYNGSAAEPDQASLRTYAIQRGLKFRYHEISYRPQPGEIYIPSRQFFMDLESVAQVEEFLAFINSAEWRPHQPR